MRADVVHGAGLEDEDLVGVHQRRQSVRDDDQGRPWAIRERLALTIARCRHRAKLVASSSIKIRGLPIRARAIARRWRCPPDRLVEPS